MIECDVIYWWPLWVFWLAHRSEAECHNDSFSFFPLKAYCFYVRAHFLKVNKADDGPAWFFFLAVLESDKGLDEQSIDWRTESPVNCCLNMLALKICSLFWRVLVKGSGQRCSQMIRLQQLCLRDRPCPSAACACANNLNCFRMNYSNFMAIWLFI